MQWSALYPARCQHCGTTLSVDGTDVARLRNAATRKPVNEGTRSNRALLPFKRYVVRYWSGDVPGEGRTVRDETLAGRPPVVRDTGLGRVYVYTRQADGSIHVIGAELVRDVQIEQSDRYGDWHHTGTMED